MSGLNTKQLGLRNAFRYGYFLLLSTVMPLLVMLWAAVLFERYSIYFNPSPVYSAIAVVILLGLGLIMPLFMALWLIVSAAVLRRGGGRPMTTGGEG